MKFYDCWNISDEELDVMLEKARNDKDSYNNKLAYIVSLFALAMTIVPVSTELLPGMALWELILVLMGFLIVLGALIAELVYACKAGKKANEAIKNEAALYLYKMNRAKARRICDSEKSESEETR